MKMPLSFQNLDPILIGEKTAAQLLGVSARLLAQWRKDGLIPFAKIGGRVLYSPNILKEWAARKFSKDEYDRVRKSDSRRDLSNSYVRQLIVDGTSISQTDVPPELVAAKRANMRIKREIKKRCLRISTN